MTLLVSPCVQAAFVVNTDGTVTDTTTSLVWDRCTLGASGSNCLTGAATGSTGDKWVQAFAAVEAANTARYKGFDDWRLPNKNELESLVDRALGDTPAKIDRTAFPATVGNSLFQGRYWTSTTLESNPAFFWYVEFGRGNVLAGQKSAAPDASLYYMRLVRGGNGTPSYTIKPGSTSGHLVSVAPTTGLADTDPRGPQAINIGQSVAYTFLPAPGYQVQSASGCSGTLVGNTYTTSKHITGNCVVYPVMAQTPVSSNTQPAPALGTPALLALVGLVPLLARRRRSSH
ncbi:MAG: DUF1566 domain-containing protein [Proteobacteria bacterium]|nr:DUF1566 domain-containing protein [Pseudomonadota bacterium]